MEDQRKKVTILTLKDMKRRGEKIAALSIYDALHARLFERALGDVIIVGDSAGMVIQNRPNTLGVTMDEMIIYAQAVRRGTDKLFVVGDMPLGSYEVSNEDAVRSALRFIKEAGCNAVKIETNQAYVDRVRAVANLCLVIAHLGLNPNKAEILGGYRTQGRTRESADELLRVATAVEKAGAFLILLESVTEEVAALVRQSVKVPVIGIAAGRKLDGQLVISADLLGLYEWPGNKPKHFEQYRTESGGLTIADATLSAFSWYTQAVKDGSFPKDENVHHIPEKEHEEFHGWLKLQELESDRKSVV